MPPLSECAGILSTSQDGLIVALKPKKKGHSSCEMMIKITYLQIFSAPQRVELRSATFTGRNLRPQSTITSTSELKTNAIFIANISKRMSPKL